MDTPVVLVKISPRLITPDLVPAQIRAISGLQENQQKSLIMRAIELWLVPNQNLCQYATFAQTEFLFIPKISRLQNRSACSTVYVITRDTVRVIVLKIFIRIYLIYISREFEDCQSSSRISRVVAKNIIIFYSFLCCYQFFLTFSIMIYYKPNRNFNYYIPFERELQGLHNDI